MKRDSQWSGAELRNLRKHRRMTQRELAERSGLTESWVSHYECNRREPGFTKLAALARGLRMRVGALATACLRER